MNVVKLIAKRRLQTGGTSIRNRAARSEAGLLGRFAGRRWIAFSTPSRCVARGLGVVRS